MAMAPRAGRAVDPDAVRDFYRGRVPGWWIPDRDLVVEELPHGATGKLNKAALRRQYGALLTADAQDGRSEAGAAEGARVGSRPR